VLRRQPTKPDAQAPVVTITAPAEGDTLQTDTTWSRDRHGQRGRGSGRLLRRQPLARLRHAGPFSYAWIWGELGDDNFHHLRATAVDKGATKAPTRCRSSCQPVPRTPCRPEWRSPHRWRAPRSSVIDDRCHASDTGAEGAAVASSRSMPRTLLGVDTESLTSRCGTPRGWPWVGLRALRHRPRIWPAYREPHRAGHPAGRRDPAEVAITTAPAAPHSADAVTARRATRAGSPSCASTWAETLVGSDSVQPFEQPALALLYWADGAGHDVTAEAEDFAGNTHRSDPVAVTLDQPATAWLSEVLAVAGPGDQDGYHFARPGASHPEIRYRGTQIDTIDVKHLHPGQTRR